MFKDEFIKYQHSVIKSIVLHLLPGLLLLLFYIFGALYSNSIGVPTLFILYLGVALVIIPFEIGYMVYQGKKLTGKFSLKEIVVFKQSMPVWQYIILILPMLLYAFILLSYIANPLNSFVYKNFFYWLPEWFKLRQGNVQLFGKSTLLLFWGFYFICNISGAFVEELYFRGYLLPRMSRFGYFAPLINVFLFSLYHFFTPEENLFRMLALLPMVYVVWWKRNINIGIILHCGGNAAGLMVMLFDFIG